MKLIKKIISLFKKNDDCTPKYSEVAPRAIYKASLILLVERGGSPVVDWHKELKSDDINWDRLSTLSGNWVSCACGNECVIIPRACTGIPIDINLRQLGLDFHFNILDKNTKAALETLKQIEKRSQVLINEIRSKEV